MRFPQASILGITALLSGISANLPLAHAERQLRNQAQQRQLSAPNSSECVIMAVVKLLIDPENATGDDIDFVCELEGKTFVIDLDNHQKQTMKHKLNNGELVSNESTMIFEEGSGIMIGDDMIHVPPGLEIALGKSDSAGPTGGPEGDKPILVVRVTDKNGKVRPESTAQVGDDVFGTISDPVNLKSQFSACSWEKLNIIPGNNQGKSDVPGVIDVTIPLALDEGHSRYTIHDSVTAAVETKLGGTLPGPYQQVMYVLEKCYGDSCGWAAYAYINSWMSVYQDRYYKYSGVQMHELGHNFGFAHSGFGGASYADHTCLMGNPLYSDDVGKMCFNGAKNWQIGWYDDKKETYDSNVNPLWSKRMVGIANYGNDPDNHPVIVKLETGSSTDYFVAFNRAAGPNEQNDLADDEVTIVRTGSNGEAYSQSWLEATLQQGETWSFTNWRGSGKTLTVTAEAINIGVTVGYADVKICLGSCESPPPTTPPPTDAPTTRAPTPAPTDAPTFNPSAPPVTSPPTTSTECKDSPALLWIKREKKSCNEVANMCSNYKINLSCPKTCGSCEYDMSDAALPFYLSANAKVKWTCMKVFKLDDDLKGKKCSNTRFSETCRATCEPFAPPSTSSPTSSPTIAGTSSKSWMLWTTPDNLVNEYIWDIREIEFYESVDCSGDKIPNTGRPFDSGHFMHDPNDKTYAPEQAFGGSGLWGGRRDSNGLFYIGMEYSAEKTVRCAKVTNVHDWHAKELTVRAFNENEENWDNIVVATDLDMSRDAVNIIYIQ